MFMVVVFAHSIKKKEKSNKKKRKEKKRKERKNNKIKQQTQISSKKKKKKRKKGARKRKGDKKNGNANYFELEDNHSIKNQFNATPLTQSIPFTKIKSDSQFRPFIYFSI